ncbi:MAG: hypothetical protein E6J75_01625 [Deltaproteobacteria bacterium]|nr:MAG: hypothetical protein E6J79_13695 [Deltaproteobacteria bacterium]TMA60200.1 MAG: hypothetical protein E6J75_01625 [Deltaproteobacteria bacterium]
MRSRGALLILLAGAACSGRTADVYPPDVVRNFMTECTARGDERACRCALQALERRFDIEQFRGFEARMREGTVPKEVVDAANACRR